MFHTYTNEIFKNSKFDPVFSYLAPEARASDVLLSVWGFRSSHDADVYMPVRLALRAASSVGLTNRARVQSMLCLETL